MSPTESLVPSLAEPSLPPILLRAGEGVPRRFVEFFAAEVRNPHTRRVYASAWRRFLDWACEHELELFDIEPVHVAAYVEGLLERLAPSSVKQHLAALRKGFDYLVTGGVGLTVNPAHAVRGPRIRQAEGKTPVLYEADARAFLKAIDTSHVVGLRDRAILAVMVYSFARVGAVVRMQVRDFLEQPDGAWLRLREKGGRDRRVPAHSKAADAVQAYLQGAGLGENREAPLFQTTRGKTRELTGRALDRRNVLDMIKRRARASGFPGELTCHTWRASGITDYLEKGGRLEVAAEMAGHASMQTTRIYDRRRDKVRREEIERIRI